MLIRRMVEGDVDAVVALAAGLAEAPRWPRAAYLSALDDQSEPDRVAMVAVREDGAIYGFVVASLLTGQSELESIAVSPAAQRRGVATALMTELQHEVGAQGAEEILLEVRASNYAAIGLYERLGFETVGRRKSYYQDPVEDALLLRMGGLAG